MPPGDRQCPYCLTPVGRATQSRSLFVVLAMAAAILAIGVAVFILQQSSSPKGETEGTATSPIPIPSDPPPAEPPYGSGAPAEFEPPSYAEEKTVLDAYNNLKLAAEHRDHDRLRNSISKGGWAEIRKNGYDPIDYTTPDIEFDNMKTSLQQETTNRALLVFTGSSAMITDEKGNPAPATGIYRFEREDGRWKIHSLVWHIHPPTDPVPEAVAWLNQ